MSFVSRTTGLDLTGLSNRRAEMARNLEERLERFCDSAPLSELSVVFHSTGVNYAHQFWVMSRLGVDRLSQFKHVDFVSGSVIAAVVYYSYQTGNLQYGPGDSRRWEKRFFEAHDLRPMKSALRVPSRLLRGRPVLSQDVQIDVIRAGIGKEFGETEVSFFPKNFRFWLFDEAHGQLACATADGALNSLKLVELAVAATSVPRLFPPFRIGDLRFVDPVFSSGRRALTAKLRENDGPTLVSNMILDGSSTSRSFLRPHVSRRGRIMMVRELLQFCFGLSNVDHLDALEGGLIGLRLSEMPRTGR